MIEEWRVKLDNDDIAGRGKVRGHACHDQIFSKITFFQLQKNHLSAQKQFLVT